MSLVFQENAKFAAKSQTDLNVLSVRQIQRTGDKNDVKTRCRNGWNNL